MPTSTAPTSSRYKSTLPQVSPKIYDGILDRRATASRALKSAIARRDRQRSQIKARGKLMETEERRMADERGDDALSSFASKGLARQPRFAGKELRGIRDQLNRRLSSAEADRQSQFDALDRMVQDARRNRDRVIAGGYDDMIDSRVDFSRILGL